MRLYKRSAANTKEIGFYWASVVGGSTPSRGGRKLGGAGRGRVLCRVRFEDEVYDRLMSSSGSGGVGKEVEDEAEELGLYGLRYTFKLMDGDDAAAVDAPEWLVPLPLLRRLAGRHLGDGDEAQELHALQPDLPHDAFVGLASRQRKRKHEHMPERLKVAVGGCARVASEQAIALRLLRVVRFAVVLERRGPVRHRDGLAETRRRRHARG